jgi:hypothetical protein
MDDSDELAQLWDRILSREPETVRAAFAALSAVEAEAVRTHLQRMVSEPDWHPEQRVSAQAALTALEREQR